MIRTNGGKPYKAVGNLQQFDPENPEHCLFNLWDEEVIKIGGAPIYYYEVMIQIGSLDRLYREDRGKLWSPIPIQLWAIYEPIPPQNMVNPFGIDAPDEMIFELNYQAVLRDVGHPPKIGARIHTPHKREDWVVVQRNLGEYKMWGEIRLELICQRFQESVTTGEGKITSKKISPEFKIN